MKVAWFAGLLTVMLMPGTAICGSAELDSTKAELMGRVEDFFTKNFRDVTWRRSLEWGETQTDANGGRSIRYKYEARIWDRETIVVNQEFTFDKNGRFVRYKDIEGFPKKREPTVPNVRTQSGLKKLVEGFFRHNYRDISERKTIEWGQVTRDEKGNASIRYKYKATLRDQQEKMVNQVFTFDRSGTFVTIKDVKPGAQ